MLLMVVLLLVELVVLGSRVGKALHESVVHEVHLNVVIYRAHSLGQNVVNEAHIHALHLLPVLSESKRDLRLAIALLVLAKELLLLLLLAHASSLVSLLMLMLLVG